MALATALAPGSLTRVEAGGTDLCLARTADGGLHCIGDVCTHEEYSLSEGELLGFDVECPAHGSRFDVRTGRVDGLPAVVPARVFAVSLEGEDVYVEV